MTNLQKLEALLWGMFWTALGGATTGVADIIATLADYPQNDWHHTWKVAAVGAGMGAFSYLKQQKALFTPPPVLVEDTVTTIKTPVGQPDIKITEHKETQTVKGEDKV